MRLHGWRILDRRVRARTGEVDLVAHRGNVIAFVEVKARATMAQSALAIDEYRLRRVAAAVTELAPRYAKRGEDVRIDVIHIVPRRWPVHVVNAWLG